MYTKKLIIRLTNEFADEVVIGVINLRIELYFKHEKTCITNSFGFESSTDVQIIGRQVVDGIVHLTRRITTRVTGKDVAIHVGKSSAPGIVNVGWSIGIDLPCRHIHTGNGKVISVAFDALQGA